MCVFFLWSPLSILYLNDCHCSLRLICLSVYVLDCVCVCVCVRARMCDVSGKGLSLSGGWSYFSYCKYRWLLANMNFRALSNIIILTCPSIEQCKLGYCLSLHYKL